MLSYISSCSYKHGILAWYMKFDISELKVAPSALCFQHSGEIAKCNAFCMHTISLCWCCNYSTGGTTGVSTSFNMSHRVAAQGSVRLVCLILYYLAFILTFYMLHVVTPPPPPPHSTGNCYIVTDADVCC